MCPTHVEVLLEEEEVARNHDFSFFRSFDSVVLRGEAPDDVVRARLVREARAKFSDVVDSMRVSDEAEGPAYAWAVGKAFDFLDRVQTGRISWENGVLSAVGRTGQEPGRNDASSL